MSYDIVAGYNLQLANSPPLPPPSCSLLPRKRSLTPPPPESPSSESLSTPISLSPQHGKKPSRLRYLKLPSLVSNSTRTPDANTRQITCNAQSNSPLFTLLPRELRDIIYTELLAPRHATLHIISDQHGPRSESRLVTIPCYERRTDIPAWDHRCWVSRREAERKHEIPKGNGVVKLGKHRGRGVVRIQLEVLRVCRRVYTEALPILYEKNTFALRSSSTISALPQHILPARLNSIRSIHFSTRAIFTALTNSVAAYPVPEWSFNTTASWLTAWGVLASMSGLRELVVTLDAEWGYDLERTIPWLLGPMRGVCVEEYRVLVVCEVDLEGVIGGLGELPFRLEVVRPLKSG
ncbi:hypothetical protein BJY00DRAFT_94417 [Aspergillus carlsbadensis]|nr:hypothetical protein BJY00DRAFT_94417 [Aspergillus carlsbadensis]